MVAEKSCAHGPYQKFSCYGKSRESLKMEILAKGASTVKTDNFLRNLINKDSLSIIKYY